MMHAKQSGRTDGGMAARQFMAMQRMEFEKDGYLKIKSGKEHEEK